MVKSPWAIVIGGHFQGLGTVRALSRHQVPVLLLDHEPNLSRFSRHVTRFRKSPDVRDKAALEFYMGLASELDFRGAVIFPTDDETVFFLAQNWKLLSEHYRLMTQPWDITRLVYNKKLTYRLAQRIGIEIPRTWYPRSIEEVKKTSFPFPVIVKPAVMRTFFRQTGKKVFRAANPDTLLDCYQRAAAVIPAEEILIQEEIPEVSKNLYSFCPFFKHGETMGFIVARRPRQHPMDFGQASTFAETVNRPELEETGSRFLKAMKYYGLAEVEFIRDPRDGKFKFLEVNPRIWGWHTLALKAGVNLPFMVYQDLTGKRVQSSGYRVPVRWVRLLTDIPTVLSEIWKRRMTWREYLDSLRGDLTFAVWSKKDPLPFFAELLLILYLWKKRGF